MEIFVYIYIESQHHSVTATWQFFDFFKKIEKKINKKKLIKNSKKRGIDT